MKREVDTGQFMADSVAEPRHSSSSFEHVEEHTTLMTTIAMNIKQCRRKLGWSQKELGNQAGLSLKAIGEIERGNRAVSVRSLHMISRALRVTPAELLIPPRATVSPLEDQLKRFVLQARQFQVPPGFVELCTKMIEQTSGKPSTVQNGHTNGGGTDEQHLHTHNDRADMNSRASSYFHD